MVVVVSEEKMSKKMSEEMREKMSEEMREKLLDVITNNKYKESEREELFNELSDEWLSTGNNLNQYYYFEFDKVSE